MIGPYRIRGVAGRGAVGIVYHAVHEVLDKEVALKTLNPNYAGEEIFRERFSREAQGAAAVNHPNIITVFDAGEHEGIPYLVMTYVAGPDLEQVLLDHGGRLSPDEAILICALIADALDAAALQGLAHRDVKPANILLEGWESERYGGRRRNPHAYLTDFGLIKSSAQATVTRTGQFVGTLLYMSPEQIQSKAIPASDQYSLACVLWECLTGTLPFMPTGASTLSILTAHLNDPVPRISQRPGGGSQALDNVFWRALAKQPEDRYPTCVAFMDAATQALGLGHTAPSIAPKPPLAGLSSPSATHTPTQPKPTPPKPTPPKPTPSLQSPPTPVGQGGPGRAGPAQFPEGLPVGHPGGMVMPTERPQQRSRRAQVIALVIALLVVAAVVAWLTLLR